MHCLSSGAILRRICHLTKQIHHAREVTHTNLQTWLGCSHLMTVMQTHTGKHALPVIWGNTKTNLPPYEADTLNHAREVTHTNLQTWLGCTSHHHHPQPSNDSHANTHRKACIACHLGQY